MPHPSTKAETRELVIQREKKGSTTMHKARKTLFGVLATLLLTAVAFTVPAGSAIAASDGGGSPSAVAAKKKCKKGFVKKKRKCVKKRRAGAAWAEGRWAGHYAENGVELLFNVVGNRLYTGGFDSFFVYAPCTDGFVDPVSVAPVQASIASNGNFSGSGVYTPGFGNPIPWQLSGHISGRSITGGTFTAGPYIGFYGGSCGVTTHFTAQWIAAYTF
jgi:hypothetical protein